MTPRVSVIIRTYNRARYLGEAIDSVLGQSFGDRELIVVDDGSTDGTSSLLERYDRRLTPIFLGRTANQAIVFNAGIRAARGELIAFLDSDDIWLPRKLDQQLALLDADQSLGFAYGNVRLLYPSGQLSAPVLAPDQIVTGSVLHAMVRNMCVHPSTAIIRRRWLERVGLFDEQPSACEDYVLFLRLARLTNGACVAEPVSLIRQHDAQLSKAFGLATYVGAVGALEELLHDRTLSRTLRLAVRRSIARHHAHLALELAGTGQMAEARRHAARALWRYPLHRPAWRSALRCLTGPRG